MAEFSIFQWINSNAAAVEAIAAILAKIVVFLLAVSMSHNAFASCSASHFDVCHKYRVLKAEKYQRPANFLKKSSPVGTYCDVELEDIGNGEVIKANTKKCPKFKEPQYLFVHFACNDVLGILPAPDVLEVWPASKCETDPSLNLKEIKKKLKTLNHPKTIADFKKLGLELVGLRRNPKISGGHQRVISVLHSYPGVSVDVSQSECWSSKDSDCVDSKRISEVAEPREEFITAHECEIWGGAPGSEADARKSDLQAFSLGVVRPCKIGAEKRFQVEMVNGVPPKVGPVSGIENATVLSIEEGMRLLKACPKAFWSCPGLVDTTTLSRVGVPHGKSNKEKNPILPGVSPPDGRASQVWKIA
jgi:hypothetical protein